MARENLTWSRQSWSWVSRSAIFISPLLGVSLGKDLAKWALEKEIRDPVANRVSFLFFFVF